jgi:hypothetical protein
MVFHANEARSDEGLLFLIYKFINLGWTACWVIYLLDLRASLSSLHLYLEDHAHLYISNTLNITPAHVIYHTRPPM